MKLATVPPRRLSSRLKAEKITAENAENAKKGFDEGDLQ